MHNCIVIVISSLYEIVNGGITSLGRRRTSFASGRGGNTFRPRHPPHSAEENVCVSDPSPHFADRTRAHALPIGKRSPLLPARALKGGAAPPSFSPPFTLLGPAGRAASLFSPEWRSASTSRPPSSSPFVPARIAVNHRKGIQRRRRRRRRRRRGESWLIHQAGEEECGGELRLSSSHGRAQKWGGDESHFPHSAPSWRW